MITKDIIFIEVIIALVDERNPCWNALSVSVIVSAGEFLNNAEDRRNLRRALRLEPRDHDHGGRHAGDPHRSAGDREARRRSDRDRAGIRQLCAGDRTRRRERGPGADGRAVPRALEGGAGSARPAHPRDPGQLAAQPERNDPARARSSRTRVDRGRARPVRRLRRGLRAHGVRRRAAPVGQPLSAAGGARLRHLVVRQDVPRHRLEGRVLRGTGAADRRVPQDPPVQRVLGEHADAARSGRLHARSGAVARTRGLLPAQARPVPCRTRCDAVPAAALRGHLLPGGRLQRDLRPERGRIREMADRRDRRGGDSAVGVLRRAGREPHGALLLRQGRRDAARGARAPRQTVAARSGPPRPRAGLRRLAARRPLRFRPRAHRHRPARAPPPAPPARPCV